MPVVRARRARAALASAALAIAGAASPATAAGDAARLRLVPLAEATLPVGTVFEETCVGGLSGLAPLGDGRYLAVSDARQDARLYTLRLDVAEGPEAEVTMAVAVVGVTRLLDREGEPYPPGRVDPEGLALLRDDAAFVSTDGVTTLGVPPVVDLVDVGTGEWLQGVSVPLDFRPRGGVDGNRDYRSGIQYNLGFEALTLTPDRRRLVVGAEAALLQERSAGGPGAASFSRLLVYDIGDDDAVPRLRLQALYPQVEPPGDLVVHGLVELLALDDAGRLLALERTFANDRGFTVRLYEALLPASAATADGSLPVADKRLVLDLGEAGLPLQNYEGLAFGPRLADGTETVLVLADNDKPTCPPEEDHIPLLPTRLLLFRLER